MPDRSSIGYDISIDELQINVAIYKIIDSEIYISDMNKAAQITEHVSIKSIVDQKLVDIFPAVKEFGLYDVILEVFKTGETRNFDIKYYNDDRIKGWRANRISKLSNGMIMAVYEDLTEQKAIEEEFQKEKQLLEEAQSLAHLGSWDWNIKTNEVYWSNEVFRIFGEEPQSFDPSYDIFKSYIPIDDIGIVEEAITNSLENKEQYRIIHRIIIDGQTKYVQETGTPFFDDQGNPSCMRGSIYDITNTHNYKLELQKKTKELKTIFELNPHITFITNGKELLQANHKFLEFTGFSSVEEFKEHYDCLCELFCERQGFLQPIINNRHWVNHVANHPQNMHKALIEKDEQEFYFLAHATRFTLDNSHKYLVVLEDISALEVNAHTDFLTQLYNRNKMHEMLQASQYRFERYNEAYSAILIDVDHFKKINDTLGHQVGDHILQEISKLFKKELRDSDIIGRWGGEEFLLIAPNTSKNEAYKVAEKLRLAVELQHFKHIDKLTVSIGCSSIRKNCTIEQVLHEADQALYTAKHNGRNQVHNADPKVEYLHS